MVVVQDNDRVLTVAWEACVYVCVCACAFVRACVIQMEYVVRCLLLWGEGSMCAWRESASVIMHDEHAQQPSGRPFCLCVYILCVCVFGGACMSLMCAFIQVAFGRCRRSPRPTSIFSQCHASKAF